MCRKFGRFLRRSLDDRLGLFLGSSFGDLEKDYVFVFINIVEDEI